MLIGETPPRRRTTPMTRRRLLRLGSLAAGGTVALGAVACTKKTTRSGDGDVAGGAPDQDTSQWPTFPSDAEDGAEITYWRASDTDQSLVEQFMKEFPSIKVNAKLITYTDIYSKIPILLRAGSGAPDVSTLEYDHLPAFVDSDSLINLASFASAYKDYYPSWLWDQVAYGDQIVGFPADTGPVGAYYNAKQLAEFKIEPPKTWDDLAAAARQVRSQTKDVSFTYFQGNGGNFETALFWQAGARPTVPNDDGSWSVNFTSKEIGTVIDFWSSLIDDGSVPMRSTGDPQFPADMAARRYAYMVAPASRIITLGRVLKPSQVREWKVAPMPQWDSSKPAGANMGGSAYTVLKQTKYPRASAIFAAWMTLSQPGVELLSSFWMAGTNLAEKAPNFKSPTKPPLMDDQPKNPTFFAMQQLVDTGFRWSPWTDYIYNTIQDNMNKAATGSEKWADVMPTVQASVKQFATTQGYKVK